MNMHSLLNEDNDGYAWEGDYEQTWAAIQEDERGILQTNIHEFDNKARKRQMLCKETNIRLSMMRHMYIVIDLSTCMTEKDLKPSRILCVIKLLGKFIYSFFDQNPISQLGVIVTYNKRAEKFCDLMGNPRKIIDKLKSLNEKLCDGEISIQNSLEIAMNTLQHLKSHTSREVLFVIGSLSTCDPNDVFLTIQECKKYKIRCSVIQLAAEVHLFKHLSQETEGLHTVILDEAHFNDSLQQVAFPLPNSDTKAQSLIRMGFPQHKISKQDEASMCMCHLTNEKPVVSSGGYFCPQCDSKYCEIPVECKACGLTLVCAPHLARSYHHLFPLPAYIEIKLNRDNSMTEVESKSCYGCQLNITQEISVFRCPDCENIYCIECDIFIHETMHSCPGCCSATKTNK